jgi:hypothetical protein
MKYHSNTIEEQLMNSHSAGPMKAAKNVRTSHSPYSNNDPIDNGIAVFSTYLTAGTFLSANVFVRPDQKGSSHPLNTAMLPKRT